MGVKLNFCLQNSAIETKHFPYAPRTTMTDTPSCRTARVTKFIPGIAVYIAVYTAPEKIKMRLPGMILFTTFKLF